MTKTATHNPFSAGNGRENAHAIQRKTHRSAGAAETPARRSGARPADSKPRGSQSQDHSTGTFAPDRIAAQRGRARICEVAFSSSLQEEEIERELLKLRPRLREKILRIAYFVASRLDRRRADRVRHGGLNERNHRSGSGNSADGGIGLHAVSWQARSRPPESCLCWRCCWWRDQLDEIESLSGE